MKKNLTGNYLTLDDRAFFQVQGPDAKRYLNGQITQSIEKASTSQAAFTCVTNAKGKLQAVGFIREWGDGYLIDCPMELRESLFQRLDMYLIADDAILSDLTGKISLYHLIGESTKEGGWSCKRLGVAGYDTMEQPTGDQIDNAEADYFRIFAGIPHWGSELDETLFPPEARLEQSAICYHKGCYTGQEVISRIKAAGKVNKLLYKFRLSENVPLPFAIPNPDSDSSKPAGTITSIAKDQKEWIGLGYLTRKFFDHKTFSSNGISITVMD